MPDTPTQPDLVELLNINRTLARLIEPLEMLLAMERAPGIGDRLDTLMADLSGIREQMQRAADTMEQALERRQEDRDQEAQTAAVISEMQKDIRMLKAWFAAPLPAAGPTS